MAADADRRYNRTGCRHAVAMDLVLAIGRREFQLISEAENDTAF